MYVAVKPGIMFQYFCPDCGYQREGLLNHPMYSWSCPKCGRGHYAYKEVRADTKEGEHLHTTEPPRVNL